MPYDVKINENAARTLEYAYDDWCIYRMGEKLGRPAEELELYKSRSQNYRNLFDPETKLMRGDFRHRLYKFRLALVFLFNLF